MLGDLPAETVEVVRTAMASFAHSLRLANQALLSPSRPRGGSRSGGMREPGVTDTGLFAGLFAHGEVAAAVSDRAFVDAMVEFEVALLRALAVLEIAPAEAADELSAAVEQGALELDLTELGTRHRGAGHAGSRGFCGRFAGSSRTPRRRISTRARRART